MLEQASPPSVQGVRQGRAGSRLDATDPKVGRAVLSSLASDYVLRIPLALFHGLIVYLVAIRSLELLLKLGPAPSQHELLTLGTSLANLGFMAMLFWMTVFRTKPIAGSSGFRARAAAIAGSLTALSLNFLPRADLPDLVQALALLLMLAGCASSLWTAWWLGRSYSVMPQARRLVTTGPYAIVRHPLYLCEELAILGLMLVFLSPLAVALVATQWFFQLRRMMYEENVLRSTFPEYEDYAARVPRIIPSRLFTKVSAVRTTA